MGVRLEAAARLIASAVSTTVVNLSTLAPLDTDTLRRAAKAGEVLTVSEHSIRDARAHAGADRPGGRGPDRGTDSSRGCGETSEKRYWKTWERQRRRRCTVVDQREMARLEEQRVMAKVARLYYEQGLRQTEIVE